MNSLSGNPFVPDPDKSDTADGRNVTYATLALVFEQRTANLIALAEFYGNDGHREHGLPILKEINTRLGLNGDTK